MAFIGDFEPDGILACAADRATAARALARFGAPVFTGLPLAWLGTAPLRRPALYLDAPHEGRHQILAAAAALSRLPDGIAIITGCGEQGVRGYRAGVPLQTLLESLDKRAILVATTAVPAGEEIGDPTATAYVATGHAACACLNRLQQIGLVTIHLP